MERVHQLLRHVPVWSVWVVGLIPLALLVADTLSGALGADPVRMIEHRLGRTAIYLLIGGLAVTPLRRHLNLMRFRRAIGLLCFTYAALHVAAWAVLDMGLLWAQLLGDVVKRPYLIFGMTGFVALTALAMTSNNLSIRRMGRNWRRLHWLVYPAAILVSLHWIWSLKLWEPKPLVILAVIGVLLATRARFPPGRKRALS